METPIETPNIMEGGKEMRMSVVKFLNTSYVPSDEKLRELWQMQELIHWTRVQYFHEIRNENPRMQVARIEELRKMYRARWEVISNDEVGEE